MYITEEKLVEAYGKANPHERFLLIYKNYSVLQTGSKNPYSALLQVVVD